MDVATSTSDAASMHRRNLLEQLITIRSLMHKNGTAAADDDSRDVIKDLAKKGITLNKEQLAALSTEFLLSVLLDLMLLRLLDEGEEGGATVPPAASSSEQQQVMDDAAAAKKRKKAAAKKKRYKRNKAAAKRQQKETRLMSWLGGGIISVIMMVAFSFITTPIVTLSLIKPSDGSGEGKAPPALPPSVSKSLRQEDIKPNDEASTSPADIIISPLAAVVPPPVFAPTALSNHRMRMKSDEMRESTSTAAIDTDHPTSHNHNSNLPTYSPFTPYPSYSPTKSANPTQFCLDTPNWKDKYEFNICSYTSNGNWLGDMEMAAINCCHCDGGGGITCEDFRSKCQKYIWYLGFNDIGLVAPLCKEAESCSCEAAGDHDVEVVDVEEGEGNYTVGLYNECKCDFWLRLCGNSDTQVEKACDYAAEYCCGDYMNGDDESVYNEQDFFYLNSPTCYCDFYYYTQYEFGYTLKPKALNSNEEFPNPCGILQDRVADYKVAGAKVFDYRLELERPSLEAIYNETNGRSWTNSAGWMNESVDHCQWHGITCDGDGFVTGIDLRDNNLSGQFPVYTRNTFYGPIPGSDWQWTKYGLANLYNLKSVVLADNELNGAIDYRPLYNLHSLSHFDVSGNQLSGDMDALISPSLTYVDFSNNLFTYMLSFKEFKQSFQTLRFCDLSNNEIKNDASDLLESIPPNIARFFASNNLIYGKLPASFSSLPKLSQFDMSSNALSGSLPGFADSILSLQQLDLSNQTTDGFTGSIPKDLWRFQSLKVLNLAGNKLAGTISPDIGNMAALEEFDLSNNLLSGQIPSQLGQLAGNRFDDSSTAPLSLCKLRNVKEFDLANGTELCPVERDALSEFYDSTKGAEWTNDTNWLDEFTNYCDWHGVRCVKGRVTKLELSNNGLSGRLSESIGHLTLMEVLDLSDNDIKASIPKEIGLLSELTYLRLSYNAFTGTAPGVLGKLTKLQVLQLQSNRITKIPNIQLKSNLNAEMPNIPNLNEIQDKKSTFVTDCGVPSAFDETPECKDCTMCCEYYYYYYSNVVQFASSAPQYLSSSFIDITCSQFAAVFFACFIVLCCVVVLFIYFDGKRKNRGYALTMSAAAADKYALSKIGKESVYSYFVTEKPIGWLAASATLGIQVGFLAFFVVASEANLQKDTIDIEFTWKCPRDSDVCDNKADLTKAGWAIFSLLMIAFLAKDMINGCKLINHSSKVSHTLGSRIRYFIGGMCLCSITLFALYVSCCNNVYHLIFIADASDR
eukprot:scaffold6017_cov77-Skeletonema_dohrnii-CCMP3373.AAC.2